MVAENNLYFDRVAVLNMARRQDRWSAFQENVKAIEWPFPQPQRFEGIDGWKLPTPNGWGRGMAGGYGCMQGHRRILESAIIDDLHSILVCEDDATFPPDIAERFAIFWDALPSDWEFLFIGGQSNGNLEPVNQHVARVHWANRWHCYAVRGGMIRDLYQFLNSKTGHCDLISWPWLKQRKVYAPIPQWLSCQSPGWSDIASCENEWLRCWNEPVKDARIVYLRCPREVAEELYRMKLLHPGFNRDRGSGIDVWLRDKVKEHGTTGKAIAHALAGFAGGLTGEALQIGPGTMATIFHPDLPPETVRDALGSKMIEVEADTVRAAVDLLAR